MKPRGPIMLLMTNPKFRLCLIVAMLPAFYLGAFYQLLERKLYYPAGVDATTGQNLFEIGPQYRIAGIETAMRPALWIDRHLRNDFWTTIEHSNGRKWTNP